MEQYRCFEELRLQKLKWLEQLEFWRRQTFFKFEKPAISSILSAKNSFITKRPDGEFASYCFHGRAPAYFTLYA